jgi:signal peptidase I
VITSLLAIGLLLAFLQRQTITVTPVSSLYPTLQGTEVLLVNRLTYRFQVPRRGAIVRFDPDAALIAQGFEKEKIYFRRVVGLPGEMISVQAGRVYINNQLLNAPYNTLPKTYQYGPKQLPANTYLLLGNNPNFAPSNSAPFGAEVSRSQIKGQLLFRLFPPNQWGRVFWRFVV